MMPFFLRRPALSVGAVIAVGLIVFWFFAEDSAESDLLSAPVESASQSAPTESAAYVAPSLDTSSAGEAVNSPSVQKIQDHDEWLREIVKRLIARNDGRSSATAAAVMHAYAPLFKDPSELRADFRRRIFDLLDRAATQAPADPPVLILAHAYCLASSDIDCDTTKFDHALQASDSGNAFAWLGALARAKASQNRAQQEEVVRAMANASRVDTHYLDIESMLTGVIESVRVPIPESALQEDVRATQTVAATALRFMPKLTLAPIGSVCNQPIADDLLANCQRVVELARDEEGKLPGVALAIAQQLSRPGALEAQSLAETQRRRNWQFSRALSLPRTAEQTQRIAGGDYNAAVEVLIANGVPLDPPSD